MDDQIWTFQRAQQRLEIRCCPSDEGVLLTIAGDGAPRSYFFQELSSLVRFQSDMEQFLLKTGWSFVEFSPDRRTGRDRRTFPRLAERRRWWTDSRRQLDTVLQQRRRS